MGLPTAIGIVRCCVLLLPGVEFLGIHRNGLDQEALLHGTWVPRGWRVRDPTLQRGFSTSGGRTLALLFDTLMVVSNNTCVCHKNFASCFLLGPHSPLPNSLECVTGTRYCGDSESGSELQMQYVDLWTTGDESMSSKDRHVHQNSAERAGDACNRHRAPSHWMFTPRWSESRNWLWKS